MGRGQRATASVSAPRASVTPARSRRRVHRDPLAPRLSPLPTQLVQMPRGALPAPELMQPVSNAYHPKPDGGFWTSTLTADGESAWTHHAREQMPRWLHDTEAITLQPKSSRVLVIDSIDTAERFEAAYPRADIEPGDEQMRGIRPHVDWEAVARDYDAVSLSQEGCLSIGASGRSLSSAFHTWECESTLWLRWCFS